MSVPEVVAIFKDIQTQPEKLFEMIRMNVRELDGRYLSEMMKAELTHFLRREPYERKGDSSDDRNGSYERRFTISSIGDVSVKVPWDRLGESQTQVLPRCRRYEKEIGKDLCLMFLGGVSPRTLARMSERLIGRKIPHTEISEANKELTEAVEKWRNWKRGTLHKTLDTINLFDNVLLSMEEK